MNRRIAVTGAAGFIGTHLVREIESHPGFEAVRIGREEFESGRLAGMLAGCGAVVHLAGISRSSDQAELYRINMALIQKLIVALRFNGSPVRVLFGSAADEEKPTRYHASKRDGRALLDAAAAELGFLESVGVLMPNTFGPGGKPFYNSVVATFCRQVADGKKPTVFSAAGRVNLIYVEDLVTRLFELASTPEFPGNPVRIPAEFEVEVVRIAEMLEHFRDGARPEPGDRFAGLLWRTFQSYRQGNGRFPQ